MSFPATIGDIVVRNAKLYGEKVALADERGSVTFAMFAKRVASLCAAINAFGIKDGARIAILSRNRCEYLEAACVSAGAYIAVPVNWRLAPQEIRDVLRDADPDMLIADDEFAALVDQHNLIEASVCRVSFDGARERWLDYERLMQAEPVTDWPRVEPCDRACIVYTSGTTSVPKGAELTHRGLLVNMRASADDVLALSADDVGLAPMPLFHVDGLWYHLFPAFSTGATTHIMKHFDALEVLRLIARERITHMHVVRAMIQPLCMCPDLASYDTSSLRLIFYAASSIPLAVLRRAMQAFSSSGFVQGYGPTEAGMVTCLSPQDHRNAVENSFYEKALASCGRALRHVEVKLSDGDSGEILVRSDAMMARYWRNIKASKDILVDGWLATGDLAKIDDDGFVYILDRKNDMIVTGGENVYPREVEDVLAGHSAVAEVAVFDRPHERWVQEVVAAIVLRPGSYVEEHEIVSYAKGRLAHYKCPKEIYFVETLPRNGAGKVLRKTLRAMVSDGVMKFVKKDQEHG